MWNMSMLSGEGFCVYSCMDAPFVKAGIAAANIMVVEKSPWQLATLMGSK